MLELKEYLQNTGKLIENAALTLPTPYLAPEEIKEGALLYFFRGGKRLRPALLRLFAGAYGGAEAEDRALYAALAIELFHNWTLVHDDIIDRDSTRRGAKSTHYHIAESFGSRQEGDNAFEYGVDAAILAGDSLHALSVRSLVKLSENKVSSDVVLKLIELMEGDILDRLIYGEALDTRFGLLQGEVKREHCLDMIYGKTGALFAFCAMAGTMIGLGSSDLTSDEVKRAMTFGLECGLAFQLQDDILSLTSDQKTFGKPVLNDIREGKNTLIKHYAYTLCQGEKRAVLERAMNNRNAAEAQLFAARDLILSCGALEMTLADAADATNKALEAIEGLPESKYKNLIIKWAEMMLKRDH